MSTLTLTQRTQQLPRQHPKPFLFAAALGWLALHQMGAHLEDWVRDMPKVQAAVGVDGMTLVERIEGRQRARDRRQGLAPSCRTPPNACTIASTSTT